MSIGKKLLRWLAILVAVVVILGSVAGIVGGWWLNRTATDVTLQAFSVVDTGVAVAEAGVNRVDTLVQDGRTEVQQAEETITTVGVNLEENSPVLTALSTRLQTRLAPTVESIRQALAPVREALTTVRSLVDIATAIPGMSQRAPRLERVDQAFDQLEQTAADVRQIDDTLRASVVDSKNQLTQEAVTTLTGLTTRVDTRLAEVEGAIDEAQSDIDAFQVEMDETESRLLLIYNLAALTVTLLMLWIIYSQVVVIRHQWRLLRSGGEAAAGAAPMASASLSVEPVAPSGVEAIAPSVHETSDPGATATPG
jgi:hypothetical protein